MGSVQNFIFDENITLHIPLTNEANISNAMANFNTSLLTAATSISANKIIQYQEEICLSKKENLEKNDKGKKYCSATFSDIAQAFN